MRIPETKTIAGVSSLLSHHVHFIPDGCLAWVCAEPVDALPRCSDE